MKIEVGILLVTLCFRKILLIDKDNLIFNKFHMKMNLPQYDLTVINLLKCRIIYQETLIVFVLLPHSASILVADVFTSKGNFFLK